MSQQIPQIPHNYIREESARIPQNIPGLVNVYITNWKDPPCFMGNFTISMATFNSYATNYHRI